LKLVSLAGHVLERIDLVRLAAPFVARLAQQTNETAHLSVPGERAAVHLIEESAGGPLTVRPRLGAQVPYHASAAGKVLLAFMPSHVSHVLDQPGERFTGNTITDPADLLVELARVRERGYAVDNLEWNDEIRSVAAPVFDHAGRILAGLGVSGPAARLLPDHVTEIATSVVDVAHSLSEALGLDRSRLTAVAVTRLSM
jgi:DNA-binding IclR family transcriptional regulator